MKSFLFSIACFLGTATAAFAQDSHPSAPPVQEPMGYSELIVGHGFIPSEQAFAGGAHGISYTNDHYSGALFATYRYHISNVISLGLTFAFENENGSWSNSNYGWLVDPPSNMVRINMYQGKFRRSAYTIAPEITFNYGDFAHGLVRLYSVVGMGYTYRDEHITYGNVNIEYNNPNVNPVHFNAYGSPLGIRVGRELSGFFEIGLGYKGVLNYGLTYRF